ncbi:hypothetical protein G9X64_15910 [Rhizobium sophorae]|uniref:Excisionase-like domain-containing protein n=2 Tax=Rhizobium sophorae TaxID=1535242 RepID=A0A7Y3WF91_9HYPH|nr:hypothetical protein [Rhizobium bangladeshense]NKL32719.1 hypothetical protein [Rhizobium leguminosarum bv. viciae]NNU37948.1 hypothetical protein [Rhizobium sophorae]
MEGMPPAGRHQQQPSTAASSRRWAQEGRAVPASSSDARNYLFFNPAPMCCQGLPRTNWPAAPMPHLWR